MLFPSSTTPSSIGGEPMELSFAAAAAILQEYVQAAHRKHDEQDVAHQSPTEAVLWVPAVVGGLSIALLFSH